MSAAGVAEAGVLASAADLIEVEGAWTQRVFARNAEGEETGLSECRGPAVCWCALGAISKIAGNDDLLVERAEYALMRLLRCEVDGIANWNDAPERTQAEVVAKLREAAAIAREQGK
jgi:hypothetical protein